MLFLDLTDPIIPASKRRSHRLKPWRVIGWVLVVAAFCGLLVVQGKAMILFYEHGRAAVEFPYTLNYGEGPLLDQTMRLLRGEPLYAADVSLPPYTITNYPPLYILLQTPMAASQGAALWYGRAITLVATLWSALMIAVIVGSVGKDALAGIAAGLTLPAIPYIFHWSALARIDGLALALSLTGIACIARGYRSWWGVLGAVVLLTAAIYTRQTYALAAPLGVFVWLWARMNIYRALVFAVGVGGLVLALFILMLVATEGGFFTHLITANVNPLDSTILTFYVDEITVHLPIFLVGGALCLTLGALVARPGWWLIAAYSVGALGSALTIAKVGSDVNYLWEFSAALCLLAGLLIASAKRVPVLRAGLLVALAFQITMVTTLSESKYNGIITERIQKRDQIATLEAYLRTHQGVTIADEFMSELVISGQRVQLQPFEFSQLARDGVWDERPLLAAMMRGDYQRIMIYQPYRNPSLRFERWTPEMLRVINSAFRPILQTAETTIYEYIPP